MVYLHGSSHFPIQGLSGILDGSPPLSPKEQWLLQIGAVHGWDLLSATHSMPKGLVLIDSLAKDQTLSACLGVRLYLSKVILSLKIEFSTFGYNPKVILDCIKSFLEYGLLQSWLLLLLDVVP